MNQLNELIFKLRRYSGIYCGDNVAGYKFNLRTCINLV